jgi:hypothetical protein
MNDMKTTHLTRTLLLGIAVSFAACLSTTEPPKEPNVFSLSITIPDAGQDLFVGNDTLTVIGFKMLIDSISVKKQGQEDEKFEPKLRLASYVFGSADYYVVGTGSVGAGKFSGVGYWIVKPSLQNTTVNDEDLIERDAGSGTVIDSYSICVTGIYDRKFFRFQSKVSRAVLYGFSDNVQLPDFNGYLEARLRGNWKQWFLNQAGNKILDPANPSNRAQIEENVLKYFDIFTIAVGEVQ